MFFGNLRRRVRQRQQADAMSRLLDLSKHVGDCQDDRPPARAERPRVDWPEIQSRHPGWWQVHRIELRQGVRVTVLIAEVRTEDEAFRVMDQQHSQTRISKWGSKLPPYVSHRDPLVVE